MTNKKKSMKKVKRDELRPKYKRSDLGRGVRGKYYKSYQSGTNLVLLSPDVQEKPEMAEKKYLVEHSSRRVTRARILLKAAAGCTDEEIVAALGVLV